jgi:hypothetical protein
MSELEQTAGTPNPDGGDAGEHTPTTGTQGEDGRNAEPEGLGTITREEALAWKAKAERVNQLESKLSEMEAQRPAPAVATPADTEDEAYWSEVEKFATQGDPVAKALLRQRERDERRERDIIDAFQLREIADAEERQQVAAHYLKNRHRYGDVAAARDSLRVSKLEADNKRLLDALKAAQAKQPDPDVVRTHSREITARQNDARKYTRDEWQKEQAELEESGNYAEKIKRQMDLRQGRSRGRPTSVSSSSIPSKSTAPSC